MKKIVAIVFLAACACCLLAGQARESTESSNGLSDEGKSNSVFAEVVVGKEPERVDVAAKYSVAILGDLHYDAEPDSVYHSHYARAGKAALDTRRKEFVRNGEMWRKRCKDLVRSNAEITRRRGAAFVLQLGDIVQGDCDDPPTHKKMLGDAVSMLKGIYPKGMPFLTVVGNHDFRGAGARKVYFEFADELLTGELGFKVSYPAFAVRHGPDCWIFCDFESCEIAKITQLVESASWARHIFLVTHGPFTIPESVHWKWRLGGNVPNPDARAALADALLKNHAVVISGHSHKVSYWRIENERGWYTELTVNSVWEEPGLATAEPIESTPEEYGSYAAKLMNESGKKANVASYLKEIEPVKRDLKEFFFNTGAGHFFLNVGEKDVSIDYYPGAAKTPARTFIMKD